MAYLIISFLFFLFSVILHLIWCRLAKPIKLRPISFFVITLISLVIYIFSVDQIHNSFFERFFIWQLPLKLSSIVLYILYIPFYFVFYYSTVVNSPSRMILYFIKEKGKATYSDLNGYITNERFVLPRIDALVEYGHVSFDGQTYQLTAQGIALCQYLNFYQLLLGREAGG